MTVVRLNSGMDAATTVRGRLATLDAAALAQLLGNRPDALIAPQPRSLDELAERLDRPESVAAALHTVPAPCIQLTEASLALGGAPTLATLTALLAESSSHHDEDVRRWLQVLADHAIAWPTADGAVAGSGALAMIFPDPLGLGSPIRALLAPRCSRSSSPCSRIRRPCAGSLPPLRARSPRSSPPGHAKVSRTSTRCSGGPTTGAHPSAVRPLPGGPSSADLFSVAHGPTAGRCQQRSAGRCGGRISGRPSRHRRRPSAPKPSARPNWFPTPRQR